MDRAFIASDQALKGTLGSMRRRIRAMEARAAWPSALRESSIDVQESGFADPTFVGDPLNYVEVMSVILGTGRWVLFGLVTHEIQVSTEPDGSGPFSFHLKVTSDAAGSVIAEREVSAKDNLIAGVSRTQFHTVAVETTSRFSQTAQLWVAAAGRPSLDNPLTNSITYTLRSATLVGFPA